MFIEPPDMHQSWIDDFEKEIDYAKESGMEVIILGDINIDYTGGCTNNQWANMIQEQSLSQIMDTPTRVTSTAVCLTRKINEKDYPSLNHKTIKYRYLKKN